jgi:hypothetical protein
MVAARGIPHARDVTSTTEDPSSQSQTAPSLSQNTVTTEIFDIHELALPTDEAVRDHARSVPSRLFAVDRTTVRLNRTRLVQGIREERP